MTTRDPLDDLLQAAVTRDMAATPTPDVARRVAARIRRRQRLRGWLLGGAVTAGVATAAGQWQASLAWLASALPALQPVDPAALLVLGVLGAGAMLLLAEESL